jgi:hypothetical protein
LDSAERRVDPRGHGLLAIHVIAECRRGNPVTLPDSDTAKLDA